MEIKIDKPKADFINKYGICFKGDCMQVMKNIPNESIALLLTDPPYGIDYQSHRKKDKDNWIPKIKNDKTPFTDFISQALKKVKISGGGYIFTRWDVQQQFIDELSEHSVKPKNILIWDKVIHGMGDLKKAYGSRYESIIWFANKQFKFPNKRPTDILQYQRITPNRLLHPNEKPVKLLEQLIVNTTSENDIVFDPFMGSGSTCLACQNTNRRYIGIEVDDKYFNVACERLSRKEEE